MQKNIPRFFDAHTHVQFSAFDADRDAVIRRALGRDVWMVNVGTQRGTSAAAIALAEQYPEGVYATAGLHPIHTARSYHDEKELGGGEAAKAFTSRGEVFDAAEYRKLASHPNVVAIGECGLDYFRFNADEPRGAQTEKQKSAFLAQIELARDVGKPLMIHCRNAFGDLIELLQSNGRDLRPGIIHFFTGTADDARKLLELGFSFTFGGVVTFARDYDESIRLIPADRILSETDAPYVSPAPYRGKRNEPAYVIEVVKRIADLKGLSAEEMEERISENARRIFAL